MIDPPFLIASDAVSNVVAWNGAFWVVPQALGPLDLDNDVHRARPGIVRCATEAEARSKLSTSPAAEIPQPERYPISWWKKTADMTSFEDGISSPIYENVATGARVSGRELPYGACYLDENPHCEGWDGVSVVVVVPTTRYVGKRIHWYVDGIASNCDVACASCGVQYKDHGHEHAYVSSRAHHRCWVRHGGFGDTKLQIDKDGDTCGAGGGSIATEGWHGFLHAGVLYRC